MCPSEQGPSTGAVLEAALAADPDDLAAHAAYADWLMQQGDPRGELIGVQLALEAPKKKAAERKELQKREAELLAAHARDWLGPLAPHLPAWEDLKKPDVQYGRSYRFARGWLHELRLPDLTAGVVRALAGAPQARLLHTLVILGSRPFEMPPYDPNDPESETWGFVGLAPLVKGSYLGNVRVLQLGGSRHEDFEEMVYDFQYNLGADDFQNVVPLVKKLPKLEELSIDGSIDDAEQLFGLKTLKHLRALRYSYGNYYPLEVLASNSALKELRSLLLHPAGRVEGDPPAIALNGVQALLNSRHLGNLTHLRLHMTDMGDAGCEEIVRSGILKRLKMLDLSWGAMTDEGARILADCPDLRNLEALGIHNNALTDAGLKALQKTKVPLVPTKYMYQHGPGEEDYLYEGEIE